MRFASVLWLAPLFGNALAQAIGPPHAGAAANGGSGGLTDLLPVIGVIVAIVVGLIIVMAMFELLKWLFYSLPRQLWRRLRGTPR